MSKSSESSSEVETETDEEPEYPFTDTINPDLESCAQNAGKNPKGAGRLLTEPNASDLEEVISNLSKELDVLNQSESKCGSPQVFVSKSRLCF